MSTSRRKDPAAAATTTGEPAVLPPPEPRFWRYSGPERLYTHIPVTVRDGDVIEYTADAVINDPDVPGETFSVKRWPAYDGCWEPHDGPATVRPDNHVEPVAASEQVVDAGLDVDAEQQQIHLDDTAGE